KAELEQGLQKPGVPEADLARLREAIDKVTGLIDEAEEDARVLTEDLADMQELLGRVQTRRAEVVREAEQREKEAEHAQKKVAELENPFTPRNVLQWFLDHGARLLVILLGMLLLHRLVI